MLYYQLLKQKYEYKEMDKTKLNNINKILSKSKIFFTVNESKKVNLKKKNNFNIILNKLSDSNYQNILIEEINKKNINSSNIYKLVNLLLNKVENEGKFGECYSNFIIDLDRIINKSGNKDFHLYNMIAERFNIILKSSDELKKENYYSFIKMLVEKGYYYKSLINNIMTTILDKENNYYDIYLWLDLNKNLQKKNVKLINDTINELMQTNDIRLLTLFENLLKNNNKTKKKKKSSVKVDKIKVKCENIIKEFVLLEDVEEIKFFIEDNKKINNIHDYLEDVVLNEIMIVEDEDFDKLINLVKNSSVFNNSKIKNKVNKLQNDEIYLDFNERIKVLKAI